MKEHVEIPWVNSKRSEVSRGVHERLGLAWILTWNEFPSTRGVTQFCRIFSGESFPPKSEVTNLKIPGVFSEN